MLVPAVFAPQSAKHAELHRIWRPVQQIQDPVVLGTAKRDFIQGLLSYCGRWGDVSCEHLAFRNYSVMGVIPSGYDRAFRLSAHKELLALHERGAIRVPVTAESPFSALPDALAALAAGEVSGKAVLIG